jgi:demethylmenaquinone methyltransferase/2-methoxy-6-polyprenyl-1,4-benzoquinol methylase
MQRVVERTPAEHARRVRRVFSSVAPRYDLMNDLMSAGVHRLWKAALVARVNPRPGEALIDVAGGTGDIARRCLRRADAAPRARLLPPTRAIVCDPSEEMLAAGARRSGPRLLTVAAEAEALPFEDAAFDAYMIAFGVRNTSDMRLALAEAFRVLKRGGRFFCLEFSHPLTDGLQTLYDAYSRTVIPWLGEVVAGDRDAYEYLVDSIRKFPPQAEFARRIEAAGFARVAYENLSAGVVAIHSGWRL